MMNSRAIMGIGTLIIFIATILVAAVAAGVIISTAGVLQQKALIVGSQSQSRLVNGVQITHVFMNANTSAKTANDVQILTRPEPASGPINFKTTYLSFFTDTGSYSASLSNPATVTKNFSISVPVSTTSGWIPFGDLDGDGINDQIQLYNNGSSYYFIVNMSETGLSDEIPLNKSLASTGAKVDIQDLPIWGNGTVYGYIQIDDNGTTTANQLDANTIHITDQIEGPCTFAKLRPETSYCIVTLTGVPDTALEYGETVFIYFKLKQSHVLHENDEFEIKIFPQDGRSTFVLERVPEVIYKTRMSVYP